MFSNTMTQLNIKSVISTTPNKFEANNPITSEFDMGKINNFDLTKIKIKMMNPKRLTFLRVGYCDVCELENYEEIDINLIYLTETDLLLGWQTCGRKKCNDIVMYWKSLHCIKNELLVDRYGKKIKIQRSNGEIESDWKIDGDAFSLYVGASVLITLKNKKLQLKKTIPLEEFEKLNGKW